MVLSSVINGNQGQIVLVPNMSLLGQGRPSPLNHLKEVVRSINKLTTRLPHLLWSMDKHEWTRGCSFKTGNNQSQHVVVQMGGTSSKVVRAMRHRRSVSEKVKGEFYGDC